MSNFFGKDICLTTKNDRTVELEFSAIGTRWLINFDPKTATTPIEIITSAVRERIELFENTYSRFRDNSLVTKISKQSGVFILPNDAKKLFDLCHKLYQLTNGYFTPMIGKTLIETGYDANYSLQPKNISTVPGWEESFVYQFPKLISTKPVQLDFGAIGKGYLIDLVGDLLNSYNIHDFCIDAGGDLLYLNQANSPLRIGLENPINTDEVIGVANIANQSLCASAGSRRHWANFHHIINPKTLLSPSNIVAVWVIATSAIVADGLTTCLFFVSPEKLVNDFNFEYLILYDDFSIIKSSNFPGEIFTKQ